MARPNLIDKLHSPLPPSARRAIDALTQVAKDQRFSLYVVGGPVRDLLLGRAVLDIDLTLEGDAAALARRAAAHLPGVRCVVHPAFQTATLKGSDFRLDVTTARSERYQRPGALPSVQPGSLCDDLRRRDFTVNAIAVALTGDRAGAIIDPFNGRKDLSAKLLRVLHEASFRDDATRILRGARYESRLGFRFEPRTKGWLERDVGYLQTISGPRLRQEVARTLREPEPERVFLRLDQLGALRAINPALSFDDRRADAVGRLRELRRDPSPTTCLALLAWELTPDEAKALAVRLALTKRETETVEAAPKARALERRLSQELKASQVVDLLAPLPPAALWALAAAASGPAQRAVLRYLRRWRYVRPSLGGHDLLALGARPGPRLGRALQRLKTAKLDGEVRSRRDEERMARELLDLAGETRSG